MLGWDFFGWMCWCDRIGLLGLGWVVGMGLLGLGCWDGVVGMGLEVVCLFSGL